MHTGHSKPNPNIKYDNQKETVTNYKYTIPRATCAPALMNACEAAIVAYPEYIELYIILIICVSNQNRGTIKQRQTTKLHPSVGASWLERCGA